LILLDGRETQDGCSRSLDLTKRIMDCMALYLGLGAENRSLEELHGVAFWVVDTDRQKDSGIKFMNESVQC
jgi:hypothetical protein